MKKVLLGLIILSVFVIIGAGCPEARPGIGDEVVPVSDVVEEIPQEEIIVLEGKSCKSRADCGSSTDIGEPFCIGPSLFQKTSQPRCTFDDEGVNFICKFKEATVLIGDCSEKSNGA